MKKNKKKGSRRQKICVWLLLFCMVSAMVYTPTLVRAEEEVDKKQSEQNMDAEKGALDIAQPEQDTGEEDEISNVDSQQPETGQVESYVVSDGNYDTTKPVIEEVILQEQGQTVNVSDTIHIKVKAYDAESDIREVNVKIGRYQNDGIPYVTSCQASYNSQTGYYECEYTVSKDGERNGLYISSVSVTDVCSNMEQKYYSKTDYYCNVNIESTGNSDITNTTSIESITLKNEGKYLEVGDKETITIKPSEKPSDNGISTSTASVECYNGSYSMHISLPYDEQKGVYEKEITISPRMKSGVWKISYIYTPESDLVNVNNSEKRLLIKNENYQPLNIDIKQHGKQLTTGDTMDIVVTNLPSDIYFAYITLESVISDVSPNSKGYQLTYDEEKGLYSVSDTISDTMYPCEWYVSKVSYSHEGISFNEPIEQESASITISRNGTVVTPTANVNIWFYKLDDSGNWTAAYRESFQDVTSADTLRSLGITELPDGQTSFDNLQFEGWVKENGISANDEDDVNVLDSRVLNRGYSGGTYNIGYYAKYDKDIVTVNSKSFGEEGITYAYENIAVPRDTTTNDILTKYYAEPKSDCKAAQFQKWEITSEWIQSSGRHYLSVRAKYDKALVQVGGSYFANDNTYKALPCPKVIAADYGTTSYGEIWNTVQGELNQVQHHKELGFIDWTYQMRDSMYRIVQDETTLVEGYERISIVPTYQNCIVDIVLYEKENVEDERCVYEKYQVIKKGDTFTLPTEVEGCTGLEWDYYYDGENDGAIMQPAYVINDDTTFIGYATPIDTSQVPDDSTNQNPTQEENTNNTGETTKPQESPKKGTNTETATNNNTTATTNTVARNNNRTNTTVAPAADTSVKEPITLTEEKVQDIITTISETDKGKDVTVEMGNATVIDKKLLEAAKENGVNLVLQMDGYSWTIDAQSIKASDLQSINLEVNLDSNAIPNKAVSKLAGGNPTKQISLTHEGNFGFAATLKFNIGKDYKDKYGNLYWYDSDGKMVFVDAGVIDENGDVSLRFSHASDYVIVMKDTKDTVGSTDVKNTPKADKADIKNATEDKSMKPIIWVVIGIILVAGIVFGVVTSKKKVK